MLFVSAVQKETANKNDGYRMWIGLLLKLPSEALIIIIII
jgi:hypothetical protein